MSRIPSFTSPLLLGFEGLLDRASRTAGSYPPFDIERIAGGAGAPARLRITLAVAGFGEHDIEVTLEQNELVVRGRQAEEAGRDYLHRGIAARRFERRFVLADGMAVDGAALKNGILTIELVRPEPQQRARRIEITSRD